MIDHQEKTSDTSQAARLTASTAVRIISDDPPYKFYEGSGEEINVIGRIRWFAREM